MHVSSDLVIGTLLSIPIGISTGLAVDPIKRWWTRRNETNHARRLDQIRSEYQDVLYNAIHSDMMIASFVLKGIYITFYVIYLVLLPQLDHYMDAIFSGTFHRPLPVPHWVVVAVSAFEVFIFVGVTVYMCLFCFRSFRLYVRVRHFEGYASTLPPEVRRPKLEKAVEDGRWNRGLGLVSGLAGDKTSEESAPADTPSSPVELPPSGTPTPR